MLNGDAARSCRHKELARVIPLQALDRAANVQRLDACRLAQIPDLNTRLSLHCSRQPRAVLRESNRLERSSCIERGHALARLDVEDLDLPVSATCGEEMAVWMEATAEKF